MSVEMATVGEQSEPPTRALAPVENGPPVVSDLLARRIGDLIAASEDAARTIREEAKVEAQTLRRTATREAVAEAQRALARIGEQPAPQLEAEVVQLRSLVADLRAQVERLSADVELLSAGPPSLPPAGGQSPPQEHDRRAMLIALNMASNGATREEAARYLEENLDLRDCDDLLDTVFRYIRPAS